MPWSKQKSLGLIREIGLVPIVRAPSPEDALRAAEAIIEGGIGIAEITMTVPNALRVMENVAGKFGEKVLLGAGTILDPESCRAALLAGGGAPTVLNAANEVAVAAFLDTRVGFLDIAAIVEETLQALPDRRIGSLEDVYESDREARAVATRLVGNGARRAAGG
jgi:hypothetical protein